MFVDCLKVHRLWVLFKEWISNVENKNVNFSTADVIFGIPLGSMNRVNFCILHAKWFIHTQKPHNIDINFDNFYTYFKGVICIERQIAINCKSLTEFNNMFNAFRIAEV